MNLKHIRSLSILKTIYFNLHYLPIRQAIFVPIFIANKVLLKKLKGRIRLNSDYIRTGMITIGYSHYGFHSKSNQTIIEILGGIINFSENIKIGKGSFVSIGESGILDIGRNVVIGGNDKIICFDSIKIGFNTRIAWDVTIIDTDFHRTINRYSNETSSLRKPISIGCNNWIGFGVTILKGSKTPNYCVIGANSFLNKSYDFEEYSMVAGNPIKVIKKGIYRQ